ncbi:hypothetical protein SJAV_26920 [Sulfurisphaera javensis]|uniref:Uncharacterized protein n=1 Tax=Sulfurisphaera javensis TaxID=2049879 RepID=A0AAT9GUY5_9CREN
MRIKVNKVYYLLSDKLKNLDDAVAIFQISSSYVYVSSYQFAGSREIEFDRFLSLIRYLSRRQKAEVKVISVGMNRFIVDVVRLLFNTGRKDPWREMKFM